MWHFTLGPSARGKGSSGRQHREAARTGNERSQIGKGAGFMERAKFVMGGGLTSSGVWKDAAGTFALSSPG